MQVRKNQLKKRSRRKNLRRMSLRLNRKNQKMIHLPLKRKNPRKQMKQRNRKPKIKARINNQHLNKNSLLLCNLKRREVFQKKLVSSMMMNYFNKRFRPNRKSYYRRKKMELISSLLMHLIQSRYLLMMLLNCQR